MGLLYLQAYKHITGIESRNVQYVMCIVYSAFTERRFYMYVCMFS